jgi:hypothetical protein
MTETADDAVSRNHKATRTGPVINQALALGVTDPIGNLAFADLEFVSDLTQTEACVTVAPMTPERHCHDAEPHFVVRVLRLLSPPGL